MTASMSGPRATGGRASKHLTVIFKGSDRCNARCRFCAVGDPRGEVVTDDDFEYLAKEIEKMVRDRKLTSLEFNFHGGEPTLLGESFLERACARIRQLPVEVTFSMQSNLLHMEQGIIDLVKKYGIRLGTSIDPLGSGRLDAFGNDAYPTWLRNYLELVKQIDPPGAIFVVTRDALGRARQLLDAAMEISAAIGRPFGLQINPVYPQGKAAVSVDQLITPEELGRFLIELWQLWEDEGNPIKLTPIQQFAARIDDPADQHNTLSCSFQGCCAATHVGIDYHLNVAGCGRRLDAGAYFGNLRDQSLDEILAKSREKEIIAGRSEALRQGHGPCRECRFFYLCNGGCPDDAAISKDDIADRFQWCDAYRMLFEAIENRKLGRSLAGAVRIHAVVMPDEAFETALPSRFKEVWVLPTEEGRNLGFEKGLARLGEIESTHVRVWVHNRHVPHLSLWERFLNRERVSVVLFEAEGLEQALNQLNDMGAHITLESLSVLNSNETDGALGRLLERFLFEKKWRSRVYPFTRILMHQVNDTPATYVNRFGLEPAPVEISVSLSVTQASPVGQSILAELARQATTQEQWTAGRAPCLQCDDLKACGGVFARGDGEPCPETARKLVERIQVVGAEIREVLGK